MTQVDQSKADSSSTVIELGNKTVLYSNSLSKTIAPDGSVNLAYAAITATGTDPIAYTEADTNATNAVAYAYDPIATDEVTTFQITNVGDGQMVISTSETAPGEGYSLAAGESGAATYTTEYSSGATSYA